jgi:dipeptidyl aminopeptidase/acylaminoacyl peptidase
LFATDTETVLLAEESLLGGVRHLELSGSQVGPRRLGPQLPQLDAELVELVELADGRSWVWLPQDCRGLVVSLHGGPESGERDGLRYSGLYRELLAAGVAVVVWNYPSSTGFGTGWRNAAHGHWAKALGADLDRVLDQVPLRARGVATCLLGVSFGAWAALQVVSADHTRRFPHVVLSAPMLDLESHRQRMDRAAELAEFTCFFDDTFGTPTGSGYRTAREILGHGLPVLHIVHGAQDEVVDPADTADFCDRAAATGARVSRVALEEQGHAPQDAEQAAERYRQVLDLLLQCLGEIRLAAIGTEWS